VAHEITKKTFGMLEEDPSWGLQTHSSTLTVKEIGPGKSSMMWACVGKIGQRKPDWDSNHQGTIQEVKQEKQEKESDLEF
jgi:hypothetical protein